MGSKKDEQYFRDRLSHIFLDRRSKLNLTQENVAKMLGTQVDKISKIERKESHKLSAAFATISSFAESQFIDMDELKFYAYIAEKDVENFVINITENERLILNIIRSLSPKARREHSKLLIENITYTQVELIVDILELLHFNSSKLRKILSVIKLIMEIK